MSSSRVWREALTDAATVWNDQADDLYTATKCLTEIDTGLLGHRVGPVAKVFVDRWSKRTEKLRKNAEEHAGSLTLASTQWGTVDESSEEGLKKLMPWDQRNLEPNQVGPYHVPTTGDGP
ncbi:hypothetical protein ncot_15745 [Nocardioides sp. JQ2195]|uniref:hypothetical protein n=1 Tax=Nocardioides sp. JQ2195 TaxID=2592334 RepID=UPI00143EDD07|nr:hypothetical protein [Nocardioides sp. JQ2195]QIX27876.1 hypothetical protein ncot_15745 [Nocardioides sp. JQ2195]